MGHLSAGKSGIEEVKIDGEYRYSCADMIERERELGDGGKKLLLAHTTLFPFILKRKYLVPPFFPLLPAAAVVSAAVI